MNEENPQKFLPLLLEEKDGHVWISCALCSEINARLDEGVLLAAGLDIDHAIRHCMEDHAGKYVGTKDAVEVRELEATIENQAARIRFLMTRIQELPSQEGVTDLVQEFMRRSVVHTISGDGFNEF